MKNENKMLSIIVPAYNVEKYISILLDSLLSNVEIAKCLEIIIINDGSSDNTLMISKKYQVENSDIIKVIDKENGGHGSGINAGIKMATGRYLKVIDSDDWVDIGGIIQLIEAIRTTDSDLIVNPFKLVWENGKQQIVDYKNIEQNSVVSFAELNKNGYLIPLHGFTVKTQIAKEKIPCIDEKIFYDDIEFVLYPVPYISQILILDKVLYCYRLGREGQSVEINSYVKNVKHFEKMLRSIALYYKEKIDLLDVEKKKYYLHMTQGMLNKLCDIYLYIGDSESREKLRRIFVEYNFLDLNTSTNKKLRFLKKTNYILFGVLSKYIRIKYNK